MELSRKIEISFNWWNEDKKEVDFEVIDKLEGEAEERIINMRKEGYTSGELHAEINDVEYQGWWDYNYV